MSKDKVIFVDDEEHLRLAAKQTLELADFDVSCYENAEQIPALLSQDFSGVLITDIRMPGKDGMQLLKEALEIDQELPVVLVTGHGDVQLAVKAMRLGAYDFIEKPFPSNQLIDVARRGIEKRKLTLENRELRAVVAGRDRLEARLIGRAKVMVDLRVQIKTVAQADADVLIVGETGTGKEVAARALHEISPRCNKPFVAINCGALPEGLIESELFGHEAGAFPGAARARYGKFEHAQGGTIFLDEIESMPIELQVKLLRVIQDRTISRLGSNDLIDLDVRFIAASKADLEKEANEERFRKDLLYRLNVITLRMPTLSQRQEDIPRLFTHLVNEACARYHREIPDIPSSILTLTSNKNWPGNVRELRNSADRFALGLGFEEMQQAKELGSGPLSQRISDYEKNILIAELTVNQGRLKDTYENLGLSRKSLYEKMQKYGLSREKFGSNNQS